MPRSIYDKIAFLKECDRCGQAVQEQRERLQAQKMGHMDRVFASKEAYRHYQHTGDASKINRLQKLGIWVDTPL